MSLRKNCATELFTELASKVDHKFELKRSAFLFAIGLLGGASKLIVNLVCLKQTNLNPIKWHNLNI